MANLKETRNRITSIKSTMQITSAMKMVSAAKLKRAQDAITKMRPYAEKLQEILVNLTANADESAEGKYSEEREVKNVLIIPFTSNRGLCGGFNANVSKGVVTLVNEKYADKNVSILAVGKKAGEWLRKKGYTVVGSEEEIFAEINFNDAAAIAQKAMDAFVDGTYDEVVLVYNQFVNAAVQDVQKELFLPLKSAENNAEKAAEVDYIFEPGREEIVKELIPKSLKTQFYKALLDSNAGEHGARMTAMHKATDNAGELAKELTLQYNKARQAAITTEILEIVGGANALDNA
jgi:F-type H+-transporting ATPase subunit gamma